LALGAAVLAGAVLLGTLVGVRLGWRRAVGVGGQASKSAAGAAFHRPEFAKNTLAPSLAPVNGAEQVNVDAGKNSSSSSSSAEAATAKDADTADTKENTAPAVRPLVAGPKDSLPPAGGLLVFENGKEVFRMPPAVEGKAAKASRFNEGAVRSDVSGKVQPASDVEPAEILELPPDAAQGSLLRRIEPEYPEEARKQRIQGAVIVDVRIGRDGAVQDVKLVSGHPLLADAAITAVKHWRFKPRVLKGKAVEMQTRVTLNFRMPA
jgi:TonB family protein